MKRFIALYEALDRTTGTNRKVDAIVRYFRDASPEDAAWAVFFLTGRKIPGLVSRTVIRSLVREETNVPPWLLGESHAAVGDLAETVALLLDARPHHVPREGPIPGLARWVETTLLPLSRATPGESRRIITGAWDRLTGTGLLVHNKLMTGSLRVGVSQTLVERAVATFADVPQALIAHRLKGAWTPTPAFWARITNPDHDPEEDASRPYPFFLASPLESDVHDLGPIRGFLVEYKWDGIRAQLIRRNGRIHLWTRGEESATDRFPEIRDAARDLPDGTVLDGEVLAWRAGDPRPLPFARLQTRITRDRPGPRFLREVPAVFVAYDVLEAEGADVRGEPMQARRDRLDALLSDRGATGTIRPSQLLAPADWGTAGALREEARDRGAEGLMLKRVTSPYRVGRKRGDWWKWKVDPFTMDVVLVYAQPGSGRRAMLHTDYTFAAWAGDDLTPVAKAYSGLTDDEIVRLDRWIRAHTVERFGPVRRVHPERVFELAFEDIRESDRHKSGVAVRFPRILRERTDKRAADADTLDSLKELIHILDDTPKVRNATLLDWTGE